MHGKMSSSTEAKLTEAVAKVADLASAGTHPTDAVVKVAEQYGLLPSQVALIATAYNTGAVNHHRKTAQSLFDKAAPIPLASGADAVARLYAPKKASGPDKVRNQFKGRPARQDAVSLPSVSGQIVLNTLPATTKQAFVDPKSTLLNLEKQASDARIDAERAYRDLAQGMYKLASYFTQNPKISYEDAWSESVTRHGKPAGELFTLVQSIYPKVAMTKASSVLYLRYDQAPHSDIAECLELAKKCVTQLDKAAAAVAQVEAAKPHPMAFGVLKAAARPVEPVPISDWKGSIGQGSTVVKEIKEDKPKTVLLPRGGGGEMPKQEVAQKQTATATPVNGVPAPSLANLTGPAGKVLGALPGKPNQDEIDKHRMSVLRALVNPYVMNQQRADNTGLGLSDLMTSDPVIGAHHPSKVLAHFNEISQIAPRLATQPALVRSFLRQRLEAGGGGIDPFQIEQLVRAENELRRRDDPAYGKGVLDV